MGIGLGVVTLVVGVILVTDVINVGTALVDEGVLGSLLVFVGVLTIACAAIMHRRRLRTQRTVAERRYGR